MSLVITDEFCDCGMPVEIARTVFWTCNADGTHTCIVSYQCPNGHTGELELEEVNE